MADLTFTLSVADELSANHHDGAATGNAVAGEGALEALSDALTGRLELQRILLRAAAGAGKSFILKRMVAEALEQPLCARVGVIAFANKQVYPLAADLGESLGRDRVCLWVSKKRTDIPEGIDEIVTLVHKASEVPLDCEVVLTVSHMLKGQGPALTKVLGGGALGDAVFDVLLVDEAWQLPMWLYEPCAKFGAISVGVGDVGQLPPIDGQDNPWRGDRGHNPYRAWPTAFEGDQHTVAIDLPAVWRPTAAQLPLWRAFYEDWDALDCVAGPGDRSLEVLGATGVAGDVWAQVADGTPTLVEVDGLPPADAPDIDGPLLGVVERWLDELLGGGFVVHEVVYDNDGRPAEQRAVPMREADGRPLIAVLATRNQAVDDAQEMVDRLIERHDLPPGVITANTVDSWQGQTNVLTVVVHPLSGAGALDDFNSAFGRLAVACTRATHGLLMVSRSGLSDLLAVAPARPGTPYGEPGTRQLPRQTHARILGTFARATLELSVPG